MKKVKTAILAIKQAIESLIRLESVFKQRSVMCDSGASPGLDGCRQRGSASLGQRPGQGGMATWNLLTSRF